MPKESVRRVLQRLNGSYHKSSLTHRPVTIYLPSHKKEDFKRYLLACAYCPWELESDRLCFSQISGLDHIHKQLAYAAHYGHPTAARELEKIAAEEYIPLAHKIYSIAKEKSGKEEDFEKYVIPIDVPNLNPAL